MSEVFISYSSHDRALVQELHAQLTAAGLDVWYDVRLNEEVGEEWYKVITREVRRCRFVLVLLSPHAVKSQFVTLEL